MNDRSLDADEIEGEAQRVLTAERLRELAVAVLERGELTRVRVRAAVHNGVAAAALKLEHGGEHVLWHSALASRRWIERPLVSFLMRLASLVDGSEMPEDAVAEVRRLIALGKQK